MWVPIYCRYNIIVFVVLLSKSQRVLTSTPLLYIIYGKDYTGNLYEYRDVDEIYILLYVYSISATACGFTTIRFRVFFFFPTIVRLARYKIRFINRKPIANCICISRKTSSATPTHSSRIAAVQNSGL